MVLGQNTSLMCLCGMSPLELSGHQGLLTVPRVRTEHGEAAFSFYAPQLWNKLPIIIMWGLHQHSIPLNQASKHFFSLQLLIKYLHLIFIFILYLIFCIVNFCFYSILRMYVVSFVCFSFYSLYFISHFSFIFLCGSLWMALCLNLPWLHSNIRKCSWD